MIVAHLGDAMIALPANQERYETRSGSVAISPFTFRQEMETIVERMPYFLWAGGGCIFWRPKATPNIVRYSCGSIPLP